MIAGIARLQEGDWDTSLGHFDRAVELRLSGPWSEDPRSAWVLAAAWINRSDALRPLGRTLEAIESLDRAIDAMHHVPLEGNPGYVDRLILAWINRATACGEIGRNDEAFEAFSKAGKLLENHHTPPANSRRLLAAMLHANRARLLLDLGNPLDGWKESRSAVALTPAVDATDESAIAAIRARGIHCRALAMLLDDPARDRLEQDWIARATDLVEEALTLVRNTGYQGEWIDDLICYGARIYRVCQPHFLAEFIRESSPLAPNRKLRRQLSSELLFAKADLERRVREQAHDSSLVARETRLLANLQRLEFKLAGISSFSPPPSRRTTVLPSA